MIDHSASETRGDAIPPHESAQQMVQGVLKGALNPHKWIEGVGGRNPPGIGVPSWYFEEDQAIAYVQDRAIDFFVNVDGKEVDVGVAVHEDQKFLKTRSDDYISNNLLKLPECP